MAKFNPKKFEKVRMAVFNAKPTPKITRKPPKVQKMTYAQRGNPLSGYQKVMSTKGGVFGKGWK